MANIETQIQQTEKLLLDTKEYLNSLKTHPIVAAPIVLAAEARHNGFPVELYEQYFNYCRTLNEQITQSTFVYMEQLCIPFLERTLKHLKETQQLK